MLIVRGQEKMASCREVNQNDLVDEGFERLLYDVLTAISDIVTLV